MLLLYKIIKILLSELSLQATCFFVFFFSLLKTSWFLVQVSLLTLTSLCVAALLETHILEHFLLFCLSFNIFFFLYGTLHFKVTFLPSLKYGSSHLWYVDFFLFWNYVDFNFLIVMNSYLFMLSYSISFVNYS